jgi:tetratricopeptide (TPR) repeat protein
MRKPVTHLVVLLLMLAAAPAEAQYSFLTKAPPRQRLKALWRHCSDNFISDKDSAATHQFLQGVANVADSLGDEQLKKYATYFRMCFRLLFSSNYFQYFGEGDYESPALVFKNAKAWALQKGYDDIAASCEHYIGEVYFNAARHGLAFDHLLKADEAFRKIGYENVPAISIYLSDLALHYYRFEEYDKSLAYFLSASRYPFYLPRIELNTLNSVGLIYARKKEWDKAVSFYRRTIEKAKAYEDPAWVGIASGNLGNVFLTKRQNDSALFYHRKNYYINKAGAAPEDAAKSALAIATALDPAATARQCFTLP